MSAIPRSNDLGVIYYKNGDGSGTYVDISGTTQLVGTLTGSYTEQVTVGPGLVDYSHPWVGAMPALSLFVDVVLGAATSIEVKLQGRYDSGAVWTDIQTVQETSGAVASFHSFSSSGTYLLQTSSALSVPQIRIVAKASGGGFGADDSVRVRGWME